MRGAPKDEVEAYKWWLLAAAQGDKEAIKAVAMIEPRLSKEQITEGKKRMREFKPAGVARLQPGGVRD